MTTMQFYTIDMGQIYTVLTIFIFYPYGDSRHGEQRIQCTEYNIWAHKNGIITGCLKCFVCNNLWCDFVKDMNYNIQLLFSILNF